MENLLLSLLPRRRYPVLLRYGGATLIIGAAFAMRYASENALRDYPLLLFIPAVFLSSLLFNRGTGFFATALSAVLAAYFFIGPDSLAIDARQLVPLGIFIAVGVIMAAVTETLRGAVEKLSAAERAKSLLLEEMAHRTKNDLQMGMSVLLLQAYGQTDPAMRRLLEAAVSRMQVIARAQAHLRIIGQEGRLDLAPYLETLCASLGDLLRDIRPIAVRVQCEHLLLDSSTAVSIGLIVNEAVTNALKYAFPDGMGGAVDVDVRRQDGDGITLTVRDDGIGCRSDTPEGLGSRLIKLLAQQMNGTARREPADPGCRIIVELRLDQRLAQPAAAA